MYTKYKVLMKRPVSFNKIFPYIISLRKQYNLYEDYKIDKGIFSEILGKEHVYFGNFIKVTKSHG